MDLFALGTPVVDVFVKADNKLLAKLNARKGASNFFSSKEIAQIEKSLVKKIFYKYVGDNARNVCEGFSALGGFCGFQGRIGEDTAGAYFASNLNECGIANFLEEKKGSTGKIVVLLTPDKQRTFCVNLGVSETCSKPDKIAMKNARMFYTTSITLIGNTPVAKLALVYMENCKKIKRPIAIALESPPMVAKNKKFLLSVIKKYANVLFLNEDEAEALLGKKSEETLRRLKPKIPVYLKKGKHGSLLFYEKQKHVISALKAKILDTTGAGDAYAAGVLYGLSRKYTALSSAKIGCYLATKVAEKFGAGVPFSHIRMKMGKKAKRKQNITIRKKL